MMNIIVIFCNDYKMAREEWKKKRKMLLVRQCVDRQVVVPHSSLSIRRGRMFNESMALTNCYSDGISGSALISPREIFLRDSQLLEDW